MLPIWGLTRSRGGTGPVFCAPAEGGWAPGPASQQAITHPLPGLRPGLEALPGRQSSSLGPPALGRVAPAVPLQVHEAMAPSPPLQGVTELSAELPVPCRCSRQLPVLPVGMIRVSATLSAHCPLAVPASPFSTSASLFLPCK